MSDSDRDRTGAPPDPSPSGGPAGRSMRDFDYFSDDAVALGHDARLQGAAPAQEPEEPTSLEERLEAWRTRQRRISRFVMLATAALAACVWLLADHRDRIVYAFSDGDPRPLGDVVALTPRQIPHNTYVRLSGITEHRGVTQKRVRGIGLGREDLWTFRLVGSQGVFIDVPADPKRYGPVTQLTVEGRAVDPEREEGFEDLLAFYHQRFVSERRPALRVIEVGVAPGHGRVGYLVAFAFVGLLAASNGIALARLLRARRHRPR